MHHQEPYCLISWCLFVFPLTFRVFQFSLPVITMKLSKTMKLSRALGSQVTIILHTQKIYKNEQIFAKKSLMQTTNDTSPHQHNHVQFRNSTGNKMQILCKGWDIIFGKRKSVLFGFIQQFSSRFRVSVK